MVKIDIEKIAGVNVTKAQQPWLKLPRRQRIVFFSVAFLIILRGLFSWHSLIYRPPISLRPLYNVNETVGLVTQWYEILREMRYLGEDAIAYPPHTGSNAINVTLAKSLGLDQRVIETMQLLPYFNGADSKSQGWMSKKRDVLWRDGHFVDYRKDHDILESRDPLDRWHLNYHQGKGAYEKAMMEWESLPNTAIPLSIIKRRNYGLVIVLDTASNSIVILDTQGSKTHDPFFEKFAWHTIPLEYKIPGKFYGDDLYARLAPDVLEELIAKTVSLEYIPGSVRTDQTYTPELSPPRWESWVRDLYKELQWPNFESQRMEDFLFSSPYTKWRGPNPFEKFRERHHTFDLRMKELTHHINVRYLPDWYCPVPRVESFIVSLEKNGILTKEQLEFARSDAEWIPQDLTGWAGHLVYMQGWDELNTSDEPIQ